MLFYKICCCFDLSSSEEKQVVDNQSPVATENSIILTDLKPQSSSHLAERRPIRLPSETLNIPIDIRFLTQKDDEVSLARTPSFPRSPKTVPIEPSRKRPKNVKPRRKRNRKMNSETKQLKISG